MRLYEHADFRDFVIAAARDRGLRERIVEKDYYVTEVLRLVAGRLGDKAIFKGGTSLSKGWNLIQRFSEDIDLFVHTGRFDPPLSKRGIDRELKSLKETVEAYPSLTWLQDSSQTIGGSGRSDRFGYESRFGEIGGIRPEVLLEAGVHSGDQPTDRRELSSYVADLLRQREVGDIADDMIPFSMTLLHFRRTFVEKLFTIHARVEKSQREGQPLGPYARHYYDLYCLGQTPDVDQMLRSSEYEEIRRDYDRITREHYARDYVPPPDLSFKESVALFPTGDLRASLGREYTQQCGSLCFAEYPGFDQVLEAFEKVRPLL